MMRSGYANNLKSPSTYKLMGIVNITPDSFSDGGLYLTPENAISRIKNLVSLGCDYIDIGAESSRPFAAPLSDQEEWSRLEPVLTALCEIDLRNTLISIDTYHPSTVVKCFSYPVSMINNISGLLADKGLMRDIANRGLSYVAMHMFQNPQTMQISPMTTHVGLAAVWKFMEHSFHELLELGFPPRHIYLDPGIGFGKSDGLNWALLSHTKIWAQHFQIAIGVSRKSFLQRMLNMNGSRDDASNMLEWGLSVAGASLIRTHRIEVLANIKNLLSEAQS